MGEKMAQALKDEAKVKGFVTKLIVQGALMLLETDVRVMCRQSDVSMVKGCLAEAQNMYSKIIKDSTGSTKTLKLTVADTYLRPAPTGDNEDGCLGGVVLTCQGGKISIDNTIDLRLRLVMEQDKPQIRKLLFPM